VLERPRRNEVYVHSLRWRGTVNGWTYSWRQESKSGELFSKRMTAAIWGHSFYVCQLVRSHTKVSVGKSVSLSSIYPDTSSHHKINHFNFTSTVSTVPSFTCSHFHNSSVFFLAEKAHTPAALIKSLFSLSLMHSQHNFNKLCNSNITPVHHSEHTDTIHCHH
jgi:hypothetical protein